MAGRCATCPLGSLTGEVAPRRRVSNPAKRPGIPRHRQLEVIRHLAAEDVSRAELARQMGITRGGMTLFAQRHQAQIDQMKAQLEDEFAGMWIASQRNRLAAYQADYELASEDERASHHEWLKARVQILHAVAEETGQLPQKGGVIVVPVQHVLVGVQLEDLK